MSFFAFRNCLFKKVRRFSGEPECLPRKAQAAMAFELKEEGFRLIDILQVVGIPEATYHYQVHQLKKEEPDKEWKEIILQLFKTHEGKYGYRRILFELKVQGYVINHKRYNG